MKISITKQIFVVALAALVVAGCGKPLTRTQKGAGIGTAGGAAAGAIVGKVAGNTALGAITGAVIGGAAGAIIGHKMDKQAAEIQKQVPDAKVERSGEGIVVNFSSNVLFGFDRSDLTSESKTTIDKLIDILNQYPEENVMVIGHTDSKGSDSYNQKLSERRAGSVSDYLTANGISSSRVSTKGMGESDPIVDNDTPEHRAQNRRVEFVLTASQKMQESAKQQAQK